MTRKPEELSENEVVEAVCDLLERTGWRIDQRLSTADRGVDVIASLKETKLYIEAKGATSSKEATARHGQPFSKGQVTSHVARAFYRAAADGAGDPNTRSAIALPATALHREAVEPIAEALGRLEIQVYWVDGTGARPDAGASDHGRSSPRQEIFPREDVDTCLADNDLQSRHPVDEARFAYGDEVLSAEGEAEAAGSLSVDLKWIYFRSPDWTWRHLCGREGWLLVDAESNQQHAFIESVIN